MSRVSTLKKEYVDDPLGRNYASMNARQFQDSITTVNRDIITPLTATAKTLLARLDPQEAADILDALEAAAGSINTVKWTIKFLTGDGIDIGHPNTRSQLQSLADAGVLTQTQVDNVLTLAESTVSRAVELGVPQPLPWECDHAIRQAS